MTQTTPPRPEGQIHAPNPVELFWEKNRRVIITAIAVILLAIGVNYGTKYMRRQEVDHLWSTFATSTNLDRQYASPEEAILSQMLGRDPYFEQSGALISELQQQLKDADPGALADAIQESAGTVAEPLLIWLAAHQAIGNRQWDRAVDLLEDLKNRFPDHPLCVVNDYPVQYREPVEREEDESTTPPDPPEEPELEPAVPGSQVDRALASIERDREFEQQESRFYEPVRLPDDSPKLRMTTSMGEITIGLFKDRANAHVERFLELVDQDPPFYDGQHVDQIARTDSPFEPSVQAFHFGLKSSMSQIRTQWNSTAPEENPLDFVDTPAQRELSHFPGTLSAAPAADGKSSGEQYWINLNDCASSFDGERVIVGRVIEGMDVVEMIVNSPFNTDDEATAGRGQPRDLIRIEKIERISP